MKKSLLEKFRSKFNAEPTRAVRSPLRVCPLGAHSDNQGGRTTGMAIDSSIDLVYAPNYNGEVDVYSLNFDGRENFALDDELEFMQGFWGNYLRGAVTALRENYELTVGINGVLGGSLPIGGLSSSAAVITAYLMALLDVNDISISKLELVHLNSSAERNFVGLKNGISDQAANILSQNNQLMVMDCLNDEYQLIDKGPNFPEYEIAIVYSGVTGALTDSKFNTRTDEIRVSAWLLQELSGESDLVPLEDAKLRRLSPETYAEYKDQIPGRFGRRAEHFYTEQQRVLDGIDAWSNGDLDSFGDLMFESGLSTFYNYETGIPEMKTIFDTLREIPGVYGARPSGAGFRGSVIALVDPASKDLIREKMAEVFPEKHPEHKDSYEVNFAKTTDGAHYLNSLEDL